MKCTATKANGEPCGANAIQGKRVCKNHGGLSQGGVLASNFKHGRYSRYMPERLLERYEEARADTESLSHQEDLALVDARIEDLIGRADSGEAGQHWVNMQAAFRALQIAINQRNSQSVISVLATMESVLEDGNQDWLAWGEIKEMLELRRRLAESERKRLVEMQHVVRIEEVTTLVMVIADIIRRNVDDPRVQAKVIGELNKVLTISRTQGSVRGGGVENALARLDEGGAE